ncbi:DUF883 family protein [Haliea sp. E1-2-M8]|uniref:DUF883 family protein n=1 Tax=Haliea sp. E1-2-M8 TaxID=3064706 RepID=UPI00271B075C|nr:DUF883 family protein [Haliea sp. E1-2-M8]MDO8862104.1 DUF883 family protein [Haliea sp. E1-2-M8]
MTNYGEDMMNYGDSARNNDPSMGSARKQFAEDFKAVVADAEALIAATANQGDEKLVEIRARAEESVKAAKATIAEMQSAMVMRSKEAADAVDVYVHESPWQSIGIAAGAGVIVGLMLSHR